MEWKDGKIVKLVIKSLAGEQCVLRVPNVLKTSAALSNNAGLLYNFKTQAGKLYTFTAN
jgi:alpha-L-fucosidase 2